MINKVIIKGSKKNSAMYNNVKNIFGLYKFATWLAGKIRPNFVKYISKLF